MNWRPLSERRSESDYHETLYEGIPPWLNETVANWLRSSLTYTHRGDTKVSANLLEQLERRLRLPLGIEPDGRRLQRLVEVSLSNGKFGLDAIDFLASTLEVDDPADVDHLNSLDKAFEQAGSAWTVHLPRAGDDASAPSLVRRVSPAGKAAYTAAVSHGRRSADHLSEAWTAAYGRTPNPSHAYREAVRAIEAAAKPIVTPKDSAATLGKMIAAFDDGASNFAVIFGDSGGHAAVLAMMRALWKGQHDRHGTDELDAPLSVDQLEAEAAVQIAVMLTQLFESGAVRRA